MATTTTTGVIVFSMAVALLCGIYAWKSYGYRMYLLGEVIRETNSDKRRQHAQQSLNWKAKIRRTDSALQFFFMLGSLGALAFAILRLVPKG